jgi:hypothetical protein
VFVVNLSVILNDLETVLMIVRRLKANWRYFLLFHAFLVSAVDGFTSFEFKMQ